MTTTARDRQRITLQGRVQGVGFRPAVYRLAAELGVGGKVENDARGALIEVEGTPEQTALFLQRLPGALPPLARIARMDTAAIPVQNQTIFTIAVSNPEGSPAAEITPDMTLCADCLRELFDPADRRYRYPFINCTNCGPRYSIIQSVPYDRPKTTMHKFKMCPDCQREYDDPLDRRFHAQPNACPVCGPRLWMATPDGAELPGDPIPLCAERLKNGEIIAIKGIGGFHLACLAGLDAAVERLRERKGREAKPFALMAPSLDAARQLVRLDPVSEARLLEPARPIVLAPRRPDAPISRFVAPGNAQLGVMLPYTPFHHLLFAEKLGPLVMTSGNPSEEPLCRDNAEAFARLGGIADAFLPHDRDIERGVDDSVALAGGPVLRRGRGYAPGPVRLDIESPEPILAVGGEMKGAICILKGGVAVLGEHLGELDNPVSYRNFARAVENLQQLLGAAPRVIAHDLHPDYQSSRFARSQPGATLVPIQHHHAHAAGCMAENALQRAIGIVCDGTGYGPDGAVWGGEILVCGPGGFDRAAHLCYYEIVGGDAAARETWRPALALTRAAFGPEWPDAAGALFEQVPREALALAHKRIDAGALGKTSSTGRLFDAAAFLTGLCGRNRYEAEAAMTLESTAWEYVENLGGLERAAALESEKRGEALERSTAARNDAPVEKPEILDWRPVFRMLTREQAAGAGAGALAYRFHAALARLLAGGALRAAERSGVRQAVLTGGCFANRLLTTLTRQPLEEAGVKVFTHREIPPGDGGLALGQAVAAALALSHPRE